MAEPVKVTIELERLNDLMKRMREAERPKVTFVGTEPEDIETMREEAEKAKDMGIFYAINFLQEFVR